MQEECSLCLSEATKPDGGRDRGDDHNTLATSVRAKSAPE